MDRREALKKLGVGGVAVAGTSLVLSSPAFAFTGPTFIGTPAPITFTLTKTGSSTATLAASGFPAGTCPASASPTTPSQGTPSYTWQTANTTGTGTAVSRTGPWVSGGTVTATVTVIYTCTYTGGSAPRPYQWSTTFTSSGAGNSGNFTTGTIVGPV